MFGNMLKRLIVHKFSINYLNVNLRSIVQNKCHQSERVNQKETNNIPIKKQTSVEGIKAGLEIGANLFSNSTLSQKPIITKSMIRENDKTHKTKVLQKRKTHKIETIEDSDLSLNYIRLNSDESALNILMTQVHSKKQHKKYNEIIMEGHRLLYEALECKLHLDTIIFSRKKQILMIKDEIKKAELRQNLPIQIYKVSHHDLKTWSSLNTPPGLLGIFKRPPVEIILDNIIHNQNVIVPITVICDNIRNPDNLGSIIRTCAALPCNQVILTRGCCDPWDMKALRSGCGGQFRVPIQVDIDWQKMPTLFPPNMDNHIFVAENNIKKLEDIPNKVPVVNFANITNIGEHNIVIIGGESHGVTSEAYRSLNVLGTNCKCLHIPLAGSIDSLNVNAALTLILFELKKHVLVDCK